ncbi:hypothetical protein CASFOL_025859 [Castilleja foliolosa]|uniref:Uncharacterized protein n=1 Tax=Castilleja foliolosa TaxID=1961234 RepID=A0ABD3CW24_9LAMI
MSCSHIINPSKKMSSQTNPLINQDFNDHHRQPATNFRWPLGLKRRQRLPIVRLGGKKTRRGFFLRRLCKKAKLKWLRVKYRNMANELKKYYKSLVKEILEGGRAIESFQHRMLLEASFAIPVMGLSSYPSIRGQCTSNFSPCFL